ncbi:MAG: sensor histidine kinase [Gammaproteobacteria bacterium]
MEAEIGQSLMNDADMLMEEVDMTMFERLQNVHSWSHLDIIQEARIGDVDKRLAQFLTEVEQGYRGMYRHLFYLNHEHRIVAASAPQLIGTDYRPQSDWARADVPNGEVFLEKLHLEAPYSRADMVIRAPVHDRYGAEDIGQLYGVFDLRQIFRILDQAADSSSGERFVILMDAQGRTIAASAAVRKQSLLLQKTFASWRGKEERNGLFLHAGEPLTASPVLIGYAASTGYLGFANMGWSLLIMQATDQAFQPIRLLGWSYGIVFIVTVLLAIAVAHRISGRISGPLLSLTAWVREFMKVDSSIRPEVGGAQEVRELNTAFGQLQEDLERSRRQVIHAAKLAVVGEMAAIMAHEVRTPLGILYTSAQMLRSEQDLSPEGLEMTRFILEESLRLRRLVTTLLECAKPRAADMRQQDVHAVLLRSADLLAAQALKKRLHIELDLSARNAVITCDGELLVQVFLNLILNAIQIVPAGGRIRVRTRSSATGLNIEVADDGPGIPAANRQSLFDPFFTTREGGIGLGLTVTQQIVSMHRGEISATASEWGGACFNVFLPLQQD